MHKTPLTYQLEPGGQDVTSFFMVSKLDFFFFLAGIIFPVDTRHKKYVMLIHFIQWWSTCVCVRLIFPITGVFSCYLISSNLIISGLTHIIIIITCNCTQRKLGDRSQDFTPMHLNARTGSVHRCAAQHRFWSDSSALQHLLSPLSLPLFNMINAPEA